MSTLATLTVIWAVVTTMVVVLGYWRAKLGLHEIIDVHFGEAGAPDLDPKEMRRGRKIEKLDRIGIPMTALSVLLALAMLLVWAVESAGFQ